MTLFSNNSGVFSNNSGVQKNVSNNTRPHLKPVTENIPKIFQTSGDQSKFLRKAKSLMGFNETEINPIFKIYNF